MILRIFLDDVRQPEQCATYMHLRIGKRNPIYLEEWLVVKNYDEFKEAIDKHYPYIQTVSFDHDLAYEHYIDGDQGKIQDGYKEKTGADCAQYLCDFYKSKDAPLPECLIHSMNPIGCERIAYILRRAR